MRWRILSLLFAARVGLGFQFQTMGAVSGELMDAFGLDNAQIALHIAKNVPEPKVREAKWAADHKNQGNNRSAEGRCRASGTTCYDVAAKTVKNRSAHVGRPD